MPYSGMKTTISVPDELFGSADELADELGVSRSELYARAMEEFLARHRDRDVTARLNAVYQEEDSGLPEDVWRAQRQSLEPDGW